MSTGDNGDIQLKSVRHIPSKSDVKEENGPPPAYSDGMLNKGYVPDSSQETLNNVPGNTVTIETVELEVPNGVEPRPSKQHMQLDDEVEQYEESSDEEEEYSNMFLKTVSSSRKVVVETVVEHKTIVTSVVLGVIGLLYTAYFLYAMIKYFDADDEGDVRLLWVTLVVYFFIGMYFLDKFLLKDVDIMSKLYTDTSRARKIRRILYWCLVVAVSLFIVIFVIADVAVKRPENLISALGMAVFVFFFYIFSYNPAQVKFQPVFWGLALQFIFALLILRTHAGYTAFNWLGERIREFLEHTDAGAKFVFGDDYVRHYFAFKVLMVIVFFSSIISVLYYAGVMQFVIRVIARFLAFCLGTSPTESLNAAGNIFIGQSESPLMIRPFIKDMTRSELHAVCTGGFATIAGSVLAAYILMGVPPNHLLSASVMSAPAALAMAKLFWPETKKSKANAEDVYKMPSGNEHNIIEAASNGASMSISLIANIGVNLIAFIAILEFINKTLMWFGYRCDRYDEPITFQFICSYLFYPLSWLMGAHVNDVRKVAELIGTKTFLNEFVAYTDLGVLISNTKMFNEWVSNSTGNSTGVYYHIKDNILLGNGTLLVKGILEDRSIVIATYALCGFSNLASIGIMIGALGAMAPTRRKDITKVVVRAMIAGNVACFMTACIAGLLYEGPV